MKATGAASGLKAVYIPHANRGISTAGTHIGKCAARVLSDGTPQLSIISTTYNPKPWTTGTYLQNHNADVGNNTNTIHCLLNSTYLQESSNTYTLGTINQRAYWPL
jgi:hypothetical protein